MQCREFEQRLQQLADLRQDPATDADLRAHAAICEACATKRDWFVGLARLTQAFRGAAERGSSAAFADRERLVRLAARTPEPSVEPVAPAVVDATPRRSRWWLAGGGLAVAVSAALFATLAFLPGRTPSSDGTGAPGVDVARVDAPSPTVGADDRDLPPVEAAIGSQATIAPPTNVAGMSLAPAADGALSLARLRESLTSLPGETSMTGSLRPIASSFGVAWEALRSAALPTDRNAVDPNQDQADARAFASSATA